jgi:hypothetical protein
LVGLGVLEQPASRAPVAAHATTRANAFNMISSKRRRGFS